MRRDSKEEALRWLEESEYEFETAEYLFEGERYSMVCFHSQQSAEKALKSFLFVFGEEFVFGHSIVKLCEDANKYDKEFKTLGEECGSLDSFYIPTRYPNGLPGSIPSRVYTRKNAEDALNMAKKVIDTAKEKLKK